MRFELINFELRTLKNVGRTHAIQLELIRHFPGKFVDCLPAGAAGTHMYFRADLPSLPHRRSEIGDRPLQSFGAERWDPLSKDPLKGKPRPSARLSGLPPGFST